MSRMFANLSTREKILITIAIIAAVTAVYYFYFYQPLTEEIANLEREKQQKNNRLEIAIGFAEKLPDVKEEYRDLLAELEARGVYLEKDMIDLLIDFREASKDNDLKLARFQPNEIENGITMNVNITGGFREVCNLFADLKDWNYWFEFKSLEVSGANTSVSVYMTVMYHDRLEQGVEIDELSE